VRICDFEVTQRAGGTRVSATVRFEDCAREEARLYFESVAIDARSLVHRPHAFAVAGTVLAMTSGERRMLVDGGICPTLRDGLSFVSKRYAAWHGIDHPVEVEASRGPDPTDVPVGGRAALLLSGGIDGLALLRTNRLHFPPEHRQSLRTGVFVFGFNSFDFVSGRPDADRTRAFEAYRERLSAFAAQQRLDVIRVETNLLHLATYEAIENRIWGVALASAGMAVGGEFSDLWLGSDGLPVEVHGDQASLLTSLSNSGLQLHLGQPASSRLDKMRLVADWSPARSVARSCFWYDLPEEGRVNCGRCEKCVRTMLALVGIGRLQDFQTFETDDVRPELVASISGSVTKDSMDFYPPLVGLLRMAGRADLASEVERLVLTESARLQEPRATPWSSIRRRLGFR
jgi:hypothetical protein